jgi:hypothetical protein
MRGTIYCACVSLYLSVVCVCVLSVLCVCVYVWMPVVGWCGGCMYKCKLAYMYAGCGMGLLEAAETGSWGWYQ